MRYSRDCLRFNSSMFPCLRVTRSERNPGSSQSISRTPDQVPALSTEAFRVARVASFPQALDLRTFHTSGTTTDVWGTHAFCDLSLYDLAARTAAAFGLFAGCPRMRIINLASSTQEAPTSSLSYMLHRFGEWYGLDDSVTWCVSNGGVQVDRLTDALESAIGASEPVALLGTSFAFLFADEQLGQQRFELPPGSFVMQTGGFKGRTREVAPLEMRSLMRSRYGVSNDQIVSEYGMTELSSQLYSLRGDTTYWVPGWVRATPVDPQTLLPVLDGQRGILRIDDLANVDSVCSIQTYDVAIRLNDRIELIGRAEGTTPRGCSLRMESVLNDFRPGSERSGEGER